VFYDETQVKKDFGHNIITTKEKRARQVIALLLRNKKTIINKKKEIYEDFIFKIFYSFFECFYNRGHVNSRDDRGKSRALANTNIGIERRK